MEAYLEIVRRVMETGTRKPNRTGVDTLSAFHVSYAISLAEGFPLLTTKRIHWKNIVVENLWFLSGEPTIRLLRRHGCRFWEPWASAEGRVPSAYGHLWRHHPGSRGPVDQVRWLLDELARNPMSRRLLVSAWAPENALESALPPCHFAFVLNVQDPTGDPTLNLQVTQRSCDLALGLPYNIAGYALLLHLFAAWSGFRPGSMAHTLVDAHIYTSKPDGTMADHDHVPGLRRQLARRPRPLPRLRLSERVRSFEGFTSLLEDDPDTATLLRHFRLEGYRPHPDIRFRVAV